MLAKKGCLTPAENIPFYFTLWVHVSLSYTPPPFNFFIRAVERSRSLIYTFLDFDEFPKIVTLSPFFLDVIVNNSSAVLFKIE